LLSRRCSSAGAGVDPWIAICSDVVSTEVSTRRTASDITQIKVLLPCKKSTSQSCAIMGKIFEPLLTQYNLSISNRRSFIVAL
jgi:hypothetical protein